MKITLFRILKNFAFVVGVISTFFLTMISIGELITIFHTDNNILSILPVILCEIFLAISIFIWWRKSIKRQMDDMYQLHFLRLLFYGGVLGLIAGFVYATLIQLIAIGVSR